MNFTIFKLSDVRTRRDERRQQSTTTYDTHNEQQIIGMVISPAPRLMRCVVAFILIYEQVTISMRNAAADSTLLLNSLVPADQHTTTTTHGADHFAHTLCWYYCYSNLQPLLYAPLLLLSANNKNSQQDATTSRGASTIK